MNTHLIVGAGLLAVFCLIFIWVSNIILFINDIVQQVATLAYPLIITVNEDAVKEFVLSALIICCFFHQKL